MMSSPELISKAVPALDLDIAYVNFDTSSAVYLRSPPSTLPAGILSWRFCNAHHHGIWPKQLAVDDCRPRRALLHHSHSWAPPIRRRRFRVTRHSFTVLAWRRQDVCWCVGRPTGQGRLGQPQIRRRGPNSDEIFKRCCADEQARRATRQLQLSVRPRMRSAAGSQSPSATRLAPSLKASISSDLSAPSVFSLIRPQKAY